MILALGVTALLFVSSAVCSVLSYLWFQQRTFDVGEKDFAVRRAMRP